METDQIGGFAPITGAASGSSNGNVRRPVPGPADVHPGMFACRSGVFQNDQGAGIAVIGATACEGRRCIAIYVPKSPLLARTVSCLGRAGSGDLRQRWWP